jgi:trehalose/maltose transport system substrate-binding protein
MRDRRLSLIAMGMLATTAAPAGAAEVSIACGAVGAELQICQEGVEAWSKKTGNQGRVVSTPNSSTDRLALYQQILAAGSGDIDVFQIDVIWPGLLESHMIDLAEHVDQAVVDANFAKIIENAKVEDKLVGIPWFTDVGFLFYRKDLLEKYGKQPPTTWEELSATAKEILEKERAAGNPRMEGFVFQGKAYEGLTADALEWVASYGGGEIVDAEGNITINNEKAVQSLTWAASTVGTIAPPGVMNYEEEEARGVFQSGNAVFMRNWAYAWANAQAEGSPIKDKVGVAQLPHGEGGQSRAALGGWQLAVSEYSEEQEAAIDLAKYLTSAEEQKRRATTGSYNPTIESLYTDPELIKINPFYTEMASILENAVARPSTVTGSKYNQVSAEFFGTVHSVLSKQAEPAQALEELADELDTLSRGGRW